MKIEGSIFPYKKKFERLFAVAEEVLKENFDDVCVSVNFVDEEKIQNLNKNFRKIDKKTDVLSFPNLNKAPNQKLSKFASEKDPDDGMLFLGDIVICKPVAITQAKEYGHSQTREVCFLALHSLLHLLGYDHIEAEDEKVMMRLSEKIMKKFGVER